MTSADIFNVLEAINNKIIPGSFTQDLTIFSFPNIVYKNKHNEDINWEIVIRLKKGNEHVSIIPQYIDIPVYQLSEQYIAEIIVLTGLTKGKIRKTEPTYITTGKNIGKKNETNAITQAFKDAYSKYVNKYRKTRYTNNPPPMAIQNINSSKLSTLTEIDIKNGLTMQKKLNGIRYVTYLRDNKIIQYSRTGIEFTSSKHLHKELISILTNLPKFEINKYGIKNEEELNIYKNSIPYLDGELYEHGESLEYISGQARKQDGNGNGNNNLKYYVFDIFFPYAKDNNLDMISKYRQKYLTDLFNNNKSLQYIIRVENYIINSFLDINKLLKEFLKEGYEGGIIRKDDKGYDYSILNSHSPNVIKIKPVMSDEFKIVDFTQGVKGKGVGKVIWICQVNKPTNEDDILFNVVPNMTDDNRSKLFTCLSKNKKLFDKYIKNQLLTVEYTSLAVHTNKPLQPKGIAIRTYENNDDPIKIIYKHCKIY